MYFAFFPNPRGLYLNGTTAGTVRTLPNAHAASKLTPNTQADTLAAAITAMGLTINSAMLPPITMRQMLLWALSQGITLDAINAQIAALTDATQRAQATIELAHANTVERMNPLFIQIATALGLDAAKMDAAFMAAALL